MKLSKGQRDQLWTLVEAYAGAHSSISEERFGAVVTFVEGLGTPPPIVITTKVYDEHKLHAKFNGPHPSTGHLQTVLITKTAGRSENSHRAVALRLVEALELDYPVEIRPTAAKGSGYIFEVTPKEES